MTWRNTYFLLEEVASHNTDQDCWLIIHGVVKNVSGLIEEFRHTDLVKPILREAGRDVSYWFELEGQEPMVSLGTMYSIYLRMYMPHFIRNLKDQQLNST